MFDSTGMLSVCAAAGTAAPHAKAAASRSEVSRRRVARVRAMLRYLLWSEGPAPPRPQTPQGFDRRIRSRRAPPRFRRKEAARFGASYFVGRKRTRRGTDPAPLPSHRARDVDRIDG